MRGEALAARLLASAAIQTLFMIIPAQNREDIFKHMSGFMDNTLNISGPANGDSDDEFNTRIREIARFQVMQHMDAIESMIRNAGQR